MTEDFVPFGAKLAYISSTHEKGMLVLERDNPSGLPENDDELRVPVVINSSGGATNAPDTTTDNGVASTVPIRAQFDTKIVYAINGEVDPILLETDCAARGGTFNTCGSVCDIGANTCIQACAFTCEEL